MSTYPRVLWLTPDKPANISVGRQRIAAHLEANGLTVTVRGTTPYTLLRSLREAHKYDVVVGTTRAGAISGAIINAVTGTPLVVDHVDPIRQFTETHPRWLAVIVRLLENLTFRLADHVLYVYEEERDRVERYAKATTRTNLGVEYERFADPDPEAVAAAQKHLKDLQLRENIVIYVGGLEPIYHVVELLAAMEHLNDWSLIVLGDGSLREQVRTVAAQQENVHYIGTVPHSEVPGYTDAADVGVSLVDDPHTLKVLEYDSAGLMIVQAVGRAEDRFGDHVNYCSLESKSIAAAIKGAMEEDDGDSSFAVDYDWAEVANTYHRVLRTVL